MVKQMLNTDAWVSLINETWDSAIVEGPCISGTLHWTLSKWITAVGQQTALENGFISVFVSVDLEIQSGSGVTRGCWNWRHSIHRIFVFYSKFYSIAIVLLLVPSQFFLTELLACTEPLQNVHPEFWFDSVWRRWIRSTTCNSVGISARPCNSAQVLVCSAHARAASERISRAAVDHRCRHRVTVT